MIFHVCESRSGRIVGRLPASEFEITEPLGEPSTGSVTVPVPSDPVAQIRLAELLKPRIRSVVIEDDDGALLFGGPIPTAPARPSSGAVQVPVVDWRAWFYKAPLRPTLAGARRNYIKNASNQREQGLIMTDLAAIALEPVGVPAIVVDVAPTTGISRQFTTKMFQRSIGEALDDIVGRDRGCEWHTYMSATSDPTVLLAHFAVDWPERRLREVPLLLFYGSTGVSEYTWPAGQDSPTKVWAVDGTEDVALWTSATSSKVADGTELLWEQVINLNEGTGTVSKAYAFSTALGAVQAASRLDGTAELTVPVERVPFSAVSVGDRARVVIDDGWVQADVPAARIIQRTMSGVPGGAMRQVLTVDLADISYPDDGTDPGEAV